MIDIHVLTHPNYNEQYYCELKSQLDNEPEIVLHEVYNLQTIPIGRAYAYTLGEQPYIGFVDCDDLIEPGIFAKIQAAFDNGADVVSCNEVLIDDEGKKLMPGVLLQPELYSLHIQTLFIPNINHHIFCFRRDLLSPDYAINSQTFIDKFSRSLGDCPYFAVDNITNKTAVLIPEVGYYYRRHSAQHTAWLNNN